MIESLTRDEAVDDIRWEKTMKLIFDAHAYKGGPEAWFENMWRVCVEGI